MMQILKKELVGFFRDEDGMGVIEVCLIISILIALAIIFKGKITTMLNNILSAVDKDAQSVYKSGK